jgi:hypothetical protein
MEKQKLSLSISKLSFEGTPRTNWMPFKGTCAFVDRPSDATPCGGNKPVLFPREEMEKALTNFADMGVNCRQDFSGHDPGFKIGIVKTAELQGDEVVITGGLWSLDFAELCNDAKSMKDSMGWSIEPLAYLEDKGTHDEATEVEIVGVALMLSDKAAFAKTRLAAQKKQEKEGVHMDEQKLTLLLAGLQDVITKAINDNIEGVKMEFAAQIAEVSKVTSEGFTKIEAEKEAEKAALALAAEEAQKKAEEDAKVAMELAAAEAEKTKLALEAEEAAKAQRQTLMFGTHVAKFEGENDAQKAIMENATLSPQEQFRALINLKLEQAK